MTAKKAKKKPTPAQLAARKKFAAAAKSGKFRKGAKKRKPAKKNTTIIKAKRIDHLDVSKIHSLGKVENPKRRKPNITSASDLAYAGTAKRATQGGVKGWTLGGKFFPGSATTKAHRLTSSAYLDLRTGDVWKRKAKGNPKRQNIAQGFYDGNGIFHPIRASADYDGGTAGETGGKPRHTRSKKRAAAARKASSTARSRAATKARKVTTSRLASRALQRSVPLKRTRKGNPPIGRLRYVQLQIIALKEMHAKHKADLRAAKARGDVNEVKRLTTVTRYETREMMDCRNELRRLQGKRNPSVEQKLEEWRGYPKDRDSILYAPDSAPSPLYQLGPLQEMKLEGFSAKDFRIEKPGAIWVCADTKGKIHFATKSKVPMTSLPAGPIAKVKSIDYGPVHKRQFYDGPEEFTHDFGEENGKRPTLYSDGKGGLLLKGGDYRITYRGIVN